MTTPTPNPPSGSTNKDSESTKKRRRQKVGQIGDIEFERIEPSDLGTVPVLVQALDNQWISRSLLQSVMKKGQLTDSIEKKRKKQARAEYIRALINGQQAILNRAYLYNNSVISQDYSQKKGPKREALKALLDEGVIVPYLLAERTPIDPPASGAGTVLGYGVDENFSRWQELCQEVRIRCVRLSWDDKENWQAARRNLSERFNAFATSAAIHDIDTYIQDLRLDTSARSGFRKRLVEMGQLCLDFRNQDKLVTRNDLYKAFVTAGDNPAERMYDNTKPFAGEIKQLIDLAYNSNLPDALSGYLMTPVDSLPRTALQEWQQAIKRPEQLTGEEFVKLLQRITFALVQEGLYVKSLDMLSLQDVREIRRTEEWVAYMQSLEALLNNPLQFADGGIESVYKSYTKLAQQMTRLISGQDRAEKLLDKWTPAIELVVNIAGAVLLFMWTADGATYQLTGQVSTLVTAAAVPVVVQLIIRDITGRRAQEDLTTSIDFMKFRMVDAKKQWAEIQRQVRKLPGFREEQNSSVRATLEEEAPTVNYQVEY